MRCGADRSVILPKPKPKKCAVKACRTEFIPQRPMQTWCCFECQWLLGLVAAEKNKIRREKMERRRFLLQKQELKPLQYWKERAKRAVQALARERDKDLPCISCGSYEADQWDGGHFVSSDQYPAVRFDLANINKQCRHCNKHRHGATAAYEINLIDKIGRAEVDRLKASKGVYRWTREEMQAIESDAKVRLKALKASY